jgi:hypothetical protein
MLDLVGVSQDVSEAARALANVVVVVTHDATRAGYTTGPDVQAYVRANDAPVQAAMVALAAAVLHDIAAATTASAEAELFAAVIDARKACAETRAILEPSVVALADAQDVHREASGAYSRAYDNLQTALQLMAAGPVG